MTRRTNIINNVISMAITLGCLFIMVFICNQRYYADMWDVLGKFAIGAIIAGLINTFAHELGHVIAGKKNGYEFSAMSVWFFKWYRFKNRIRFDFVMMGDEAGYTEMIPTTSEGLERNLLKMTRGALVASLIMMIIGIPPLFIKGLNIWVFCLWSVFLPIGAYFFFGNALPMVNAGAYNDGAVIKGLKTNDQSMKVAVSVMKIQAQMYNGKTPSEVDENLYFDLPQLPEDDPNFTILLNARYNYYLDKKDYENAKKVSDRLMSIVDDIPKAYALVVKTDALYNACTFDYNEEVADDLMYELEKYLNKINSASNVRAKLVYLLFVRQEKQAFETFYNKGIGEAKRCRIKGYGKFEATLFDEIKTKF